MPHYLGGYYLPFPATRRVMKNLQIDDKGVENWRLEFPVNDWLAKHGKKDVLAGVLQHPSTGRDAREDEDHGLLLITQFGWSEGYKDNMLFTEAEKEKRVKEWLINDGGAKESDLEWMSVCDKHGITRLGFVPTENDTSGLESDTIIDLTDEQADRWVAAGMPHPTEFIAAGGLLPQGA
ncbi:hypothetical protein BDZ89DRAFT_1066239 [Hymenopellis radicata]|nr:hypothetical protein BDZ89DRAFT_1076266 [Hymenopellis radicata]KAF9028274.1 hypothetical protein BDZ89DRAFT_1066239 [Hymenopellis radicata]